MRLLEVKLRCLMVIYCALGGISIMAAHPLDEVSANLRGCVRKADSWIPCVNKAKLIQDMDNLIEFYRRAGQDFSDLVNNVNTARSASKNVQFTANYKGNILSYEQVWESAQPQLFKAFNNWESSDGPGGLTVYELLSNQSQHYGEDKYSQLPFADLEAEVAQDLSGSSPINLQTLEYRKHIISRLDIFSKGCVEFIREIICMIDIIDAID